MKEPTEYEKAVAQNLLDSLDPDLATELYAALEKSASGEEFVNRIMIGNCPKCGSSNTGDCENDPEINNLCIARCFDCGQLWCPDCGELFENAQAIEHDCPFWDDIDLDDEE